MRQDVRDQPPTTESRVFEEPWQGRAFALATVLHARGAFTWPEFQRRLVAEIEAWNASHDVDAPYSYYRLWLRALERLIEERALCDLRGLEALVDELGQANPGHDHVARRDPIAVDPARGEPSRA